MSTTACPGCVAQTDRVAQIDRGLSGEIRAYHFSLPTLHCAGCIATVERGMAAMPGVRDARVNLTLKRLTLNAPDRVEVEAQVLDQLARLGYPADALDAGTLGRATGDATGRALLLRLGISGFAAMNVMLLSVAVWSGAEGATRDFLHWVSALIALPAALYCAQPFFSNAWAALKVGRMVMDTPISVAILLALGVSLYETTQSGAHAYFDAALSLTFFLLLGRVLDHHSRAAARSAAAELAALEVSKVERVTDDGIQVVAAPELRTGDRVLVRAGERMPADGTLREGATEIDRSFLTGETIPLPATAGTAVHAGEINLTGLIEIEVTAAGEDTQLHLIAEMVRAAEAAKNSYVSLADKAARVYAPVVHLVALIAGGAWFAATGDLRLSVNVATATLIITCPCALGLAVPSVMVSASGALFRRGVLLKDGTALERAARIDTVVLDKTGTLTTGKPQLVGEVDERALAVAGAMGAGSAHPLAQALASAAAGLPKVPLTGLREISGYGLEAKQDGVRVRLGRAAWIGAAETNETATWLKVGDGDPVPFYFADTPRPGLQTMVDRLKSNGLDLILLSGDSKGPVRRLADQYGIAQARSGMTPQEKQDHVNELVAEGRHVLMIGDGMNDTAALAAASVSISPASGMDVTRNAADILLMREELNAVPEILHIAQSARLRMFENFGLAASYNAVAIPIAVAGFATPLAAALAMSASSICVSLNALRVRLAGTQ
ncbi:MAG: heavy metal translocating P-type ATPase [Pseudomonadota bacterium]